MTELIVLHHQDSQQETSSQPEEEEELDIGEEFQSPQLSQTQEHCGQDLSTFEEGNGEGQRAVKVPQTRRRLEMEASHSESSEIDLLRSGEDDGSSDDRRVRQLSLARRKEYQIVEWLQDTPCLYDKGHPDFKSREKKKRALSEMAQKIDMTVEELTRWITTKRTQYGKLRKGKPTGTGASTYTDNERFILKNFTFLDPFILRLRETRTLGTKVGTKTIYICFFK